MTKVTGGKQLLKRLENITNGRDLLRKLQTDTTAEAKRLVPRKTGNLGRSIKPGYLTGRSAVVEADAGYAAYVELGTRPHIIRPRFKKALRFASSGTSTTLGGRVRTGEIRAKGKAAYTFAQEVHHPGTKPQPFLVPAAEKAVTEGGLKDTVIKLWNDGA